MKRMKGLFVLGILSLFLGVTTVTSYAESGSMTVEAGIRFTEEAGETEEDKPAENGQSASTEGTKNSSDEAKNETEGGSEENKGSLPKTGEQQGTLFTVLGLVCLLIVFFAFRRKNSKSKD